MKQASLIESEAIEYRPALNKVRRIENRIRVKNKEIKKLKKDLVLQKTLNGNAVKGIESEIEYLKTEIDKISEQKPANWEQTYKEFNNLMKIEQKHRTTYRRMAENSFKVVEELKSILSSDQEIAQLKIEYVSIVEKSSALEKEQRVNALIEFSKKVDQVKGTSEFKNGLSKAIRELKKKNVKEEKVKKI